MRTAFVRNGCLDFEALMPMPEALRGSTSGSDIDTGLAVLGQDPKRLATMLAFPWVTAKGIGTPAELRAWVEADHPDWLDAGHRAIRLIAETGYRDWHSWAWANWGTKWNSCEGTWSHEPGAETATLTFNTALDAPRPVFAALAKRPELEELVVEILAFEETWRFAYCARITTGGCVDAEVEPTPELFEQVYGHPLDDGKKDEPAPAVRLSYRPCENPAGCSDG